LRKEDALVENRRHKRSPVDIAVEFWERGLARPRVGRAKDLSQGGMLIETSDPLAFSTEVVIRLPFAQRSGPTELSGVVRWNHAGCMGVQFGLLGARETNVIAELTKG
jgi:type IV pilus assembly protein PilZ